MILCWPIVLHPKSWIKSENGQRLVALKLQSLTEMILTNTLLHPKNGSAKLSHIEWMQEEIWYISSTLSNLKHKTGDKRVAPVLSHTGDHTGRIQSSLCPPLHRGLFVVLGVQNFLPTHGADSWKPERWKREGMLFFFLKHQNFDWGLKSNEGLVLVLPDTAARFPVNPGSGSLVQYLSCRRSPGSSASQTGAPSSCRSGR